MSVIRPRSTDKNDDSELSTVVLQYCTSSDDDSIVPHLYPSTGRTYGMIRLIGINFTSGLWTTTTITSTGRTNDTQPSFLGICVISVLRTTPTTREGGVFWILLRCLYQTVTLYQVVVFRFDKALALLYLRHTHRNILHFLVQLKHTPYDYTTPQA